MSTTAAVFYKGDAYHTGGRQLLGRQVAGEGFLKGLIQHGTSESVYCFTQTHAEFSQFCDRVKPWVGQPRQLQWISADNPPQLSLPGAIFRPDSVISSLLWERRFFDQHAYSICGITHSIASKEALEDLGKLLLAPVQPWDALVCPSIAVKTVVERLWDSWSEYLAQRTGGKPDRLIQLPVIPLGVDCATFPQGTAAIATRHSLRQKWGIGEQDIVVLYMGRLSLSTKAHPVPMCMALERAQRETGATVHLLLVGWFESDMESIGFQESVQLFCPSVNTLCLDGRSPENRTTVWAAADIFISLADNLQETFGLTPSEAMASGLPVVVADWNGYQTSVRHEVDGFRIPTLLPPSGAGLDLALEHLNDRLGYGAFVAQVAMTTAVDIDACTQALIHLIQDSDLRQRMGASGRQRAEQVFDWKVVIAAHETLWQDLAEIRATASASVPVQAGMSPYPLGDDPFHLFSHYPTATLTAEQMVHLGEMASTETLNLLQRFGVTNVGAERRVSPETIAAMVQTIAQQGPQSVGTLFQQYGGDRPLVLLQTIGYLLKFDVLRLGHNG
ncbi:glycosyltransferase family 4 protein [Kovacikia minuta CCNUW1]|uniref:glycosyltransferase family 4 protein n=1 Tax=Kovacikia minuta TaxID=2931930 RepID=UPI001CCBB8AB|nr:glycosyltransferase family 4 protein [Kovacikia minuta]UBF24870.1 glycosyltransferase family 4 protein [Kovacikia minuta CCNUW1]